ncbi:hypothetical protein [Aeromonas salmonicida]|uniref:hypothetical protein n=1 Tax=Aeromonas salmonicida TaxID=645 RepID=UPI003D1965B0
MLFKEIYNLINSMKNTSIDVYELDEPSVRKKRLPNSPTLVYLGAKYSKLSITGYALAHAVVKADYLDRRNLTMPGIGFLLQASSIFYFGKRHLELKPGTGGLLNDVSLSSMAGRVGQGLAILYGHRLGLKFTAHLNSYVASLPTGSIGLTNKKIAMADFLFANHKKTVLVESKGSFTLQENDPTQIKTVLKTALQDQIDPWMKKLTPTPSNGYVIYSCLRDGSSARSAIFVVDPEGDNDKSAHLSIDIEQTMKENYGAWLRAMGMIDSATRLLNSSVDLKQKYKYDILIKDIGGHKFAFFKKPNKCYCPQSKHTISIGIDHSVLIDISSTINNRENKLQDLLCDKFEMNCPKIKNASIFPDGTIFGMIDFRTATPDFITL